MNKGVNDLSREQLIKLPGIRSLHLPSQLVESVVDHGTHVAVGSNATFESDWYALFEVCNHHMTIWGKKHTELIVGVAPL